MNDSYGGSGRYSFRSSSDEKFYVEVLYLPEDFSHLRIIFKSHGVESSRIKVSIEEAQLLLFSLSKMSKDLHWNDELNSEQEKENHGER